jgi:hypothetical protein
LEQLRETVYNALDVVRVYTKRPGGKADLAEPSVVRRGSMVGDVAQTVHKDFARNLKYAQVWGSGKFDGQRVRRDYILQDGNIGELHIKAYGMHARRWGMHLFVNSTPFGNCAATPAARSWP